MSTPPEDANEECVGPQSDNAGKSSSCEGCPNQAECASGAHREVDPAIAQVADRLSLIKHKLLILSGKGGVGKSTISTQLSWTLSESGFSVGILDIDICGPSVPRMMGVENEEVRRSNFGWSPVYASDNLAVMSVAFMLSSRDDAIIWRGPRKNGLIKQFLTDVDWGEMDFLVIDSPPGTSDEHISTVQYLKDTNVDGAIIVTTPQEVSLLDVRKEISFCRKTGINIIGVIENMSGFVCPGCSLHSEIFPAVTGGAIKMCQEMNVPFIGAIPLDPQLLRCCEKGIPFIREHEENHAAQALRNCIITVLNSSESLKETSRTQKIIGERNTGSNNSSSDVVSNVVKEKLVDEEKDKIVS